MKIGNTAQLFGERGGVEQLPRCMRRAGTGRGIGREELSRRDGLAMGNDKIAHEGNLATWLKPLGPWFAQSHGDDKTRGAVIVKATGNGTRAAGKADRRQDARQLLRLIVEFDYQERIATHQWIQCNKEAGQGGCDRYRIV